MPSNRSARIAAVLLFSLLLCLPLISGDGNTPKTGSATAENSAKAPTLTERPLGERPIRVDVQLVEVNVSVIDPYNRFVTGLEKDHFQVYEDDKEQPISHFSNED